MEGDCVYHFVCLCGANNKNKGGYHYISLFPLHTLAYQKSPVSLRDVSPMLRQALVLLDGHVHQ